MRRWLLWMILVPGIAFSQEIPTLNGHQFIANPVVFGAFTNTSFSMNLGLGSTSEYLLPAVPVGDTTLSVRGGNVLFVHLGMRYQQKVKDWLSAYLRVSLTGRIGSEPQSLFTQGVNTIQGFDIGWNVMALRREKVNLSVDFGVKNYTGNFINVSEFINEVLAGNPNASLTETVPAVQVFTGLNFAYGISQLFGVTGGFTGTYGDSFIRGKSSFDYIIQAAVDLNLYPKTKVPLGVLFSFANTSHPENSFVQNRNVTMFLTRFAFTGTEDFNLGIDILNMRVPLNLDDERVTVNQVELNVTYYFN